MCAVGLDPLLCVNASNRIVGLEWLHPSLRGWMTLFVWHWRGGFFSSFFPLGVALHPPPLVCLFC